MTEPALGIDISKLKFNACLINKGGKLKHNVFPNTATGFEQLTAWLSKQRVECVHACLEATGTYGEALSIFLHQAGHRVSVINPAAIKAFAGSRLSRTKTDRVDAELIARFCLAQAPPAWTPLPAEVRELQALVRRLESLIEMRVMEENRLSSGITVEMVRQSVEAHLTYLNQEIKRTEELIRKHINSHPGLKQQSELARLYSGHRTRRQPLSCSQRSQRSSSTGARVRWQPMRAWCHVSANREVPCRGRVRLSKIGNARLRRALYFPAITALRCSPFFQAWAEGLAEARQKQDECHLRGDAQARTSRLWSVEVREAIRSRVGKNSLTLNTVSNRARETTSQASEVSRMKATLFALRLNELLDGVFVYCN